MEFTDGNISNSYISCDINLNNHRFKVQRPETALMISIVTGVIIFLGFRKTSAIIELLKGYAEKANIDIVYFSTLLKIIGLLILQNLVRNLQRRW